MSNATNRAALTKAAEMRPMSEFLKGCPECSMSYGMSSPLFKKEEKFECSANPMHKFKQGTDGFLTSLI